MRKYLFVILSFIIVPIVSKAQTETSDFEAELRSLEAREMAQNEKEDALVDSVTEQKAAPVRENPKENIVPAPITPEFSTIKKTRRIPSR